MLISLDSTELTVLREILASQLHQLRIESARTDSHDFREGLHERERVVEAVIEKVDDVVDPGGREVSEFGVGA
jgi:hypothetical protein